MKRHLYNLAIITLTLLWSGILGHLQTTNKLTLHAKLLQVSSNFSEPNFQPSLAFVVQQRRLSRDSIPVQPEAP